VEPKPWKRQDRVDTADPLPHRRDLDETKEAACGVIVSSGHALAFFELIEEALDFVSGGIEGSVDRMLISRMKISFESYCTVSGKSSCALYPRSLARRRKRTAWPCLQGTLGLT